MIDNYLVLCLKNIIVSSLVYFKKLNYNLSIQFVVVSSSWGGSTGSIMQQANLDPAAPLGSPLAPKSSSPS